MSRNLGKTDKIFRLVGGLIIVAASIYFKSWWGLIAIIPLATASINFCPLYHLLGIKTCSVQD